MTLSIQPLSPSSRGLLPVSLCISFFASYNGQSSLNLGPTLVQEDHFSRCLPYCLHKPLLQIRSHLRFKVTFWGFRWTGILRGTAAQPIRSTLVVNNGRSHETTTCFIADHANSEPVFAALFCVLFGIMCCDDWMNLNPFLARKKKITLGFKSKLIRARIEMYADMCGCTCVYGCMCYACVYVLARVCIHPCPHTYVKMTRIGRSWFFWCKPFKHSPGSRSWRNNSGCCYLITSFLRHSDNTLQTWSAWKPN